MGSAETWGAIGPQVNPGTPELTTGSTPAASVRPVSGSSFEAVMSQAASTSVRAKSSPLNSSGSRAASANA